MDELAGLSEEARGVAMERFRLLQPHLLSKTSRLRRWRKRQLLQRQWTPPGVRFPCVSIDAATAAFIIRITGANFRLLNRRLTQIERILEINGLQQVTKTVVEAARESLVIGPA